MLRGGGHVERGRACWEGEDMLGGGGHVERGRALVKT